MARGRGDAGTRGPNLVAVPEAVFSIYLYTCLCNCGPQSAGSCSAYATLYNDCHSLLSCTTVTLHMYGYIYICVTDYCIQSQLHRSIQAMTTLVVAVH